MTRLELIKSDEYVIASCECSIVSRRPILEMRKEVEQDWLKHKNELIILLSAPAPEKKEQEGKEERINKISPTVKNIDVYSIEERLRKDKSPEGKEVWNYVQKLKEALKKQEELTAMAINKLRC